LKLAMQSGLMEVLDNERSKNGAAPLNTQASFDGGPLGGGPGNSYYITGVSLDQVRAEIRAHDEATNRLLR
jgi:hypothetical protein